MSGDLLAGLGAALAGIASFLAAWAALKRSRGETSDCEERLRSAWDELELEHRKRMAGPS